jgi:hypothetical protein
MGFLSMVRLIILLLEKILINILIFNNENLMKKLKGLDQNMENLTEIDISANMENLNPNLKICKNVEKINIRCK